MASFSVKEQEAPPRAPHRSESYKVYKPVALGSQNLCAEFPPSVNQKSWISEARSGLRKFELFAASARKPTPTVLEFMRLKLKSDFENRDCKSDRLLFCTKLCLRNLASLQKKVKWPDSSNFQCIAISQPSRCLLGHRVTVFALGFPLARI